MLPVEQQLQIMEQVATDALIHWGIQSAALELIKHRENAVYKVASGSKTYALRVHRQGYHSDRALDSELLWMKALNQSGVETPVVLAAEDGALFKRIIHPEISAPFQVDLQEWFDGTPLGEISAGQDIADIATHYKQIGIIAAKTHNQACNWEAPAHFERHSWDIDGLTGDNPFWGRFWEIEGISNDQKQQLLKCRAQLRQQLLDFGTDSDRYSMIHADFLPENILINDKGMRLIDFDDAGYGWHLFDLSTPLVFLVGTPDFDIATQALLEGYTRHRALADDHLAMLHSFIFARWTTYLGWAHTRSETETAKAMTPYIISTIDDMTASYLESL